MDEPVLELIAQASDDGKRLDIFISDRYPDLSRNQVQKLIQGKRVLVNDQIKKAHAHVKKEDIVKIRLEEKKKMDLIAEKIPLDVIYEDEDILVINKYAGMVVHPAPGHASHTIVNALLARDIKFPVMDDELRPGIVHRLDKDTSGCLVVAKNEQALHFLAKQFEQRKVRKEYLALVIGELSREKGEIDLAIRRHPIDRKKMAVSIGGKNAQTDFTVIERFKNATLLKLLLKTGRTHQIRVHMAHLGYPIIGDLEYSKRKKKMWSEMPVGRQMLHAYRISFLHPSKKEMLSFEAPIPDDMKQMIEYLRNM